MIYVLTSSGTEDGWGKPLGVFNDKEELKKWVISDVRNKHEEVREHNIDITIIVEKGKKSGDADFFLKTNTEPKYLDNGKFIIGTVQHYEIFVFSGFSTGEGESFF